MIRKSLAIVTAAIVVLSAAPVLRAQSREGITVHGHWVIEVRNPDGTLAERREFENALLTGGGDVIAQLVGGYSTPGQWNIKLNPTAVDTPPDPNSPFMTGGSQPGERLVVATPSFVPNGFELNATATADVEGDVSRVETGLMVCLGGSSTTPAACLTRTPSGSDPSFQGRGFTGKSLTTPLRLVAKQIIQVTVTLTFS